MKNFMKSDKIRMLLPLLFFSLVVILQALQASGKPPIESAQPQSVQQTFLPVLSSTDQAHAETGLPLLEASTKIAGSNLFKVKMEPEWVLHTNTLVTGLIVDCAEPSQTRKMLNSDESDIHPVPPSELAAHPDDNNLANHEADFPLLRFSLGSPPKLPKRLP
jgi:hypothetical protein